VHQTVLLAVLVILEMVALVGRVVWLQAQRGNLAAMEQRLMGPLVLAEAGVAAQVRQLLPETLVAQVVIMAAVAAVAASTAPETMARLALAHRASSSFPTPQQALSKQSALQPQARVHSQRHLTSRPQTL
jgi:hypothetical protein